VNGKFPSAVLMKDKLAVEILDKIFRWGFELEFMRIRKMNLNRGSRILRHELKNDSQSGEGNAAELLAPK